MNVQLLKLLGDFREWFEERAAIREYDGLQPRAAAEVAAYKETLEKIKDDKRDASNRTAWVDWRE